MGGWPRTGSRWWWGWALATALGSVALVRWDIAQRRESFQSQALTAHRVLSQRATEIEAVLATVLLLAPATADPAEARLPALYPQVLRVLRRPDGAGWGDPALAAADAASRQRGHAVIAGFDAGARRFTLQQSALAAGAALVVDVDRWRDTAGWPFGAGSAVAVSLRLGAQRLVLNAGEPARGTTPGFVFAKPLASAGLPFELQVQQHSGAGDWPWRGIGALAALIGALVAGAAGVQRQRAARRRAEELLRLDRVARLNTLGELAAGLAHELNQPLAAVLASTQAARRMLDDGEGAPPPALLAEALDHSRAQALRAADVLASLRRRIEQPGAASAPGPLAIGAALQRALALLQPEIDAAGVLTRCAGDECTVVADPVALDQVLHNLIRNAVQAMQAQPAGQRRLEMTLQRDGSRCLLGVRDSGPGIAPDLQSRLFQPFTGTRPGGLGLGLSLSHTLVAAMGGTLTACNVAPRGAEFTLALPLGDAGR